MDDFPEWRTRRNAALSKLDLDYARRMMPFASSDDVLLLAMHKARYECTDIARDLRHASGLWLRERGSQRLGGTALLPEGELPQ